MKTSLIVTTYNRPDLLKKCLFSLTQLVEHPTYGIYIDDASTDEWVVWYYKTAREYYQEAGNGNVFVEVNNKNIGIKNNLIKGFDKSFELGCDIAVNLDGDAIVKPDFITRLKDIKQISLLRRLQPSLRTPNRL